jgi:SAM-dependent methyltransferase
LRRIYRRIRGGKLTLGRVVGSIFVGLFIGLLPLYGLHLPLCLGLSLWLGLDGLLAYAAANISNPFFAPFIVMLEIEVGSVLFTGRFVGWDIEHVQSLGWLAFTGQTLLGALVVAASGATLGAAIAWTIGMFWRARRDNDCVRTARRRTIARYEGTRPADRNYVRIKLHTDPLTKELAALENATLGDVLDAGCGRGQFGLFLRELALVESLTGFDWDETKIESARRAAGSDGRYFTADLREAPLSACDTLLLFDVLHYLLPDEQNALLLRCANAVRPGGRLLVRDIHENHGIGAAFTRLFERVGTRLGMNRAGALAFRSSRSVVAELERLGFAHEEHASGVSRSVLLDNRLWVFRKTTT